ncbi:Uncharacterised protein [Legionella lansingensis]|uniref:Uncharacterized protein n=1 Tax=Legionella lansingensis TaxID=45067 RepID=A0A0W0VF87_9GAMM|nr:hypothetical protein [Legionella lansingensis]KTD18762.1 hypothetical protein Llan_2365 [Legionella lansingensis]SNV58617.1 Uncharacterised protein [Legionella lansingensis]
MPEIVTKHPEIVLGLLKQANIKCGVGEKQNILKTCPPDKFCSLPKGELCIYGIKDISQMTQISSFSLLRSSDFIMPLIGLLIVIFLLGMFIGSTMGTSRKK